MEDIILRFLSVSDGYGSDDGSGSGDSGSSGYGYGYGSDDDSGSGDSGSSGYGYGYGSDDDSGSGDSGSSGYGSGCGCDDGSGSGEGSGDGYGYGDGFGISIYCGDKVCMVDGVATILDHVVGNIAKGRILNRDLTTSDCWVAKVDNFFAHGNTAQEAIADATSKYNKNLPVEGRIAKFLGCHETDGTKYPAKDLFDWHSILTGSCKMGRMQFCNEHSIDIEHDEFSVQEFIELTIHSYGSEVIKQLKERL